MQYIIIIVILIIVLITLAIISNFNIKKIKQFADDEQLDEIVKKFPSNKQICEYILNKLGNKHTKLKEDKDSKANLYLIFNDTISIANISGTYTRVQTIAHECIHSIQNKTMLWFNFIFSNICIIAFFLILILTVCGIIKNGIFWIFILTILTLIFYFVRSQLEIDAMIKAKFLAKEYMEENKLTSQENIKKIINKYEELNNLGIKGTCFSLLLGQIIKIIVYAIVCLIFY